MVGPEFENRLIRGHTCVWLIRRCASNSDPRMWRRRLAPPTGLGNEALGGLSMTGFLRRGLICATVIFGGLAGGAQAQEVVDLFTEEPSESARGRGLFDPVPGISAGITGEISYFTLSQDAGRNMREGSRGGRRLRIALPEGEAATCSFPPEPDATGDDQPKLLSGQVSGAGELGHCDLVMSGDGVVGDIDTGTGRYRIVPVGGGDHAVVRIRSEGFEEEREPRTRPGRDASRETQRDSRFLDQQCDQIMNASLPPRTLGPLRVMILYTPAARANSADINADVTLLMSGLRRAFSAESTGGNFSVAVELAHAQMIDYREGADMGDDLDRLSNPSDAVFGIVPALKQRYRADIVHLLVNANEGDGCGIGWLNANPDPSDANWGLSVSDIECATGNYSFIHELGHNIGMEHDRGVVQNADPDATNYGYVLLDREVRSVMAYNNACSAQDVYCRRLPYYSSPRLRVSGTPYGRARRDGNGAYNVETLCRNAPIIAGFRDAYDFASYENQDVAGRDLARQKGLSQDACANWCEGEASCEAYTYDKWNDWCFLKGSVEGLRLEPKAISGIRPYYSEPKRSSRAVDMVRYRGKSFPGTGYETHRASNLDNCEQICRDDGHCMGFSFYASQNRCEAFASLSEYSTRSGVDSGVKTQPFAAGDE